jgi:hypothetical protein
MPKPDLLLPKPSLLACAPVMVVLVKMVSVTGNWAVPPT